MSSEFSLAAKQARGAAAAENVIVSLALAAMVLIPLAESVLRSAFGIGISGSASLVQHLTLIAGMLGGAIAAREGRLLSLATGDLLRPGTLQTAARVFANGFAAGIAALLCEAGAEFAAVERQGGNTIAYGIPIWVVQLVLPLGFAAIAVRLVLHASEGWRGRLVAAGIAGAVTALFLRSPLPASEMVVPGLAALAAATVFGAPVFTTLGGAALILFQGAGGPTATIPLEHYRLVTNPSLPTIPLFTLAGYFLAEGGASKRLVRAIDALAGGFRGGPAIVTALVCALFTSFTGLPG